MRASLEIVSGFIRVWPEGKFDPDPYSYSCNLCKMPGDRRSCELFGVHEAPTKEELQAIHRLLRSLGYESYIRTTGIGEQRKWILKG